MSLKKTFAKTALKAEQPLSKSKSGFAVSLVAAFGLMGGSFASFDLERDPGNENQDAIYEQYSESLTFLEDARDEFDAEYSAYLPSHLDADAETADVTQSLTREIEEIFTFFTDNEDDEEREQAAEDWEGLKHFAGIFARDLQTDPKLAEADAEKLITRFEDNLMPFSELGYKGTPDASDLRECQTISSDANVINQCSIDNDYANGTDLLKYGGLGALFSLLLLIGVPAGASSIIRRNKDSLQNWSQGKNNTRFRH